jgi:hypothetical protein
MGAIQLFQTRCATRLRHSPNRVFPLAQALEQTNPDGGTNRTGNDDFRGEIPGIVPEFVPFPFFMPAKLADPAEWRLPKLATNTR